MSTGWVEGDRQVLPAGLEDWTPGLFLAAVVAGVDVARLNGHDAVRLMRAQARLAAHHEAAEYSAMAEVVFSPPGDVDSPVQRDACQVEFAALEVAAALVLTRRCSESLLNLAVSLTGRLHRVLDPG